MKNFTLYALVFMAFAMTSAAQVCPTWNSNEPANNSMSTAPVMNLYPHWEQSTISSTTDVDYYKFTIPSQGYFDLLLSPNNVDLDLMLYNSNGSMLSRSDKGGTASEVITYNVVTPGTYYIRVYGYNGANSTQGCYIVGCTFFSGICRDIYEPNNTLAQAKYLSLASNVTITGSIEVAGDQDWFTFATSASKPNLEIKLSNLVVDFDIELYDANGVFIKKSINSSHAPERIVWNTTQPGTYKLKVLGYYNANARQCYNLYIGSSQSPIVRTAEELALDESDKENKEATTVFPNPAISGQQVYINLPSARTVRILNLQGQVVSEQNITTQDGKASVSLQGIEPGLYMLDTGEAGMLKFVVE